MNLLYRSIVLATVLTTASLANAQSRVCDPNAQPQKPSKAESAEESLWDQWFDSIGKKFDQACSYVLGEPEHELEQYELVPRFPLSDLLDRKNRKNLEYFQKPVKSRYKNILTLLDARGGGNGARGQMLGGSKRITGVRGISADLVHKITFRKKSLKCEFTLMQEAYLRFGDQRKEKGITVYADSMKKNIAAMEEGDKLTFKTRDLISRFWAPYEFQTKTTDETTVITGVTFILHDENASAKVDCKVKTGTLEIDELRDLLDDVVYFE